MSSCSSRAHHLQGVGIGVWDLRSSYRIRNILSTILVRTRMSTLCNEHRDPPAICVPTLNSFRVCRFRSWLWVDTPVLFHLSSRLSTNSRGRIAELIPQWIGCVRFSRGPRHTLLLGDPSDRNNTSPGSTGCIVAFLLAVYWMV